MEKEKCIGEYDETHLECKNCSIKSTCQRKKAKIIKNNKQFDYARYRRALDDKFKLEGDNMELYREMHRMRCEIARIGRIRSSNEVKIFELNNQARKCLGYGILVPEEDIDKEEN